MGKSIGKNISKNLRGKYSQKLQDHVKQSPTDVFTTGNFIGNKIANKITKISKNSQQNNSETVTNKHDNEIPKKDNSLIMEYQKKVLLDNTLNEPSKFKFKTKYWVEINDESRRTYNEDNQIRF